MKAKQYIIVCKMESQTGSLEKTLKNDWQTGCRWIKKNLEKGMDEEGQTIALTDPCE